MKTNLVKFMLAASGVFNADKFTYPLFASPKVDGIRAGIINANLLSRSLKPIPNQYVSSLLSLAELEGIDGELAVGNPFDKDVYLSTVRGIMSHEGAPDFKFYVFDVISTGPYTSRQAQLISRVKRLPRSIGKHIQILENVLIKNPKELLEYEKKCTDQGYEGIILRDLAGKYKYGRSTFKEGYLVKYKQFADGEFKIVGYKARKHNGNEALVNELGVKARSSKKAGMVELDTLGALLAVGVGGTYDKVPFEVGTGFSADLADHIWANREAFLDTVHKYKYDPNGNYEKPRFPVYLGPRSKIDL